MINNETRERISQLRKEFKVEAVYIMRKKRLDKLVDKYGIEAVALAGGWTISTVTQYILANRPVSIGEVKLECAETVLKSL